MKSHCCVPWRDGSSFESRKQMNRHTFLDRLKGLADRIRSWTGWQDQITRYLMITVAAACAVGVISLIVYDRTHCFDDYSVTSRADEADVDGTQYQMLGSHLIKYSHDGVFCVNLSNETSWSTAYTMQTPIASVCGSVMAIAEQQGNQVYVLNEKGVIGSFSTTLPIIHICISAGGQTALVLDDSDVTWINLYESDGTQIAAVKTTMSGTGYPVSAAISKDAKRMMVSFLSVDGGSLQGKLEFFDFSSAGDADSDHLAQTFTYDRVFPVVYYTDNNVPVAVADDGFIVYSTDRTPKEKETVTVEDEIVSTFYDDDSLGFVFHSSDADHKYHMEVYNLNGRQMMETDFDFEYEDVRMDNGEILLYDAATLNVYRTSGKAKCEITYQKSVAYFASLPGLRNYLVITTDSMDKIRLS